jgi:hypothetical protein
MALISPDEVAISLGKIFNAEHRLGTASEELGPVGAESGGEFRRAG